MKTRLRSQSQSKTDFILELINKLWLVYTVLSCPENEVVRKLIRQLRKEIKDLDFHIGVLLKNHQEK